jgi:two-component system, response regulator FlrC
MDLAHVGHAESAADALVACDPGTREVVELVRRVAAADVTVTLTGESGAGKEVFARFIHESSRRRHGPLVAINCAAIPESMLEATLFGHEKGAFTGAAGSHSGKFEQADGGTLLLDEITEMALGLQAKLLRVLQEREVERLGAIGGKRVDVRVIAMSNRDLRQAVTDGILREDIYYRLNVFPLRIPALRERPLDILPLAEHLLARHAAGSDRIPRFSATAARRLAEHDWPGNVRELDNVVQRALILQRGDLIEVHDLQIERAQPVAILLANARPGLETSLRASEGELILDALKAENGRRKAAAERLGISQRTLRYKLARLRDLGMSVPY